MNYISISCYRKNKLVNILQNADTKAEYQSGVGLDKINVLCALVTERQVRKGKGNEKKGRATKGLRWAIPSHNFVQRLLAMPWVPTMGDGVSLPDS